MPNKQALNNGIVLCIQLQEHGPVTIYKSSDGVMYKEKVSDEEEALSYLAEYSRVLAVHIYRQDVFSGIYVHSKRTKDVYAGIGEDLVVAFHIWMEGRKCSQDSLQQKSAS